MTPALSKILFWAPRVICLLFIPFIMMFSLDVFQGAPSPDEIAVGLLMHNIPAFVLILLLWASWKWEWVGAVVFSLLGAFYIWLSWGKFDIWAKVIISGPLFLIGILFLIGWMNRREMRLPKPGQILISLALLSFLTLSTGCATFRSELGNRYMGESKRCDAKPVSVTFIFSHVKQTVGLDAIPKLQNKFQRLQGFDDIFLDAQREISNLGKYAAYTEESSDVNDPERRAKKDSLIAANDFTLKVRIEMKKTFANYFLGTIGSVVTATLVPIPYHQDYTVTAELFDRNHKLIGAYHRSARLTKWVEAFLIVAYPFHPEERKREEIYMDFLHDIFRQIESEGVLRNA